MKKILAVVLGVGVLVLGRTQGAHALIISFEYDVNQKLIYVGQSSPFDDTFQSFYSSIELDIEWDGNNVVINSLLSPISASLPIPEWVNNVYIEDPLDFYFILGTMEPMGDFVYFMAGETTAAIDPTLSWKFSKSMTGPRIPVGSEWTLTDETFTEYFTIAMQKQLSFEYAESSRSWDKNTNIFFENSFALLGDAVITNIDQLSPIPEPTTMLLLGTGLVGMAGAARRRKRQ